MAGRQSVFILPRRCSRGVPYSTQKAAQTEAICARKAGRF